MVFGRILRWVFKAIFHIALGRVAHRVKWLVTRGFRRLAHILYDRVFTWAFRKVF